MGTTVLSADYSDHIAIKKTHYHDCHQILFITQGTASVTVNGRRYQVGAGSLVIFSRLEHHAVTNQSQDYQRYILELAPQIPDKEAYRLYSVLFNRPAGFRNILNVPQEQQAFQRIFEAIRSEYASRNTMRDEMLELLVQQLLIMVYRQTPEAFSAVEEDHIELVYRLQTRFHREFGTKFVLSELAEEYSISVSYLSHLFKMATGNSVMDYLQSCRIAEAKKCLAETAMRIGEIVEHCGFSDASNFSRTFRKVTGLSPSEFREKYYQASSQQTE